MFSFPEIAEVLVKSQDIHEGYWGIAVKFGVGAVNAIGPSGKLVPTALVPALEMGIQRFDEPNDLTVDAAVVNPAPAKTSGKAKGITVPSPRPQSSKKSG